ncbi:hypothetical protein ACOMHN_018282 [Nucella lapillus]
MAIVDGCWAQGLPPHLCHGPGGQGSVMRGPFPGSTGRPEEDGEWQSSMVVRQGPPPLPLCHGPGGQQGSVMRGPAPGSTGLAARRDMDS